MDVTRSIRVSRHLYVVKTSGTESRPRDRAVRVLVDLGSAQIRHPSFSSALSLHLLSSRQYGVSPSVVHIRRRNVP